MATKSILKIINISNKKQAIRLIKAIETSRDKGCPKCRCKDGNHAQECTLYYNGGSKQV